MTREQARQRAAQLNREHPDRARFRWAARRTAGGWEVARIALPAGLAITPLSATVENAPAAAGRPAAGRPPEHRLAVRRLAPGPPRSPDTSCQLIPHAEDASVTLNATQPRHLIERILSEINDRYLDLPVAAEIDAAIRARLKAGAYDERVAGGEFADRLGEDLRAISGDRLLAVTFHDASRPPDPPDLLGNFVLQP